MTQIIYTNDYKIGKNNFLLKDLKKEKKNLKEFITTPKNKE